MISTHGRQFDFLVEHLHDGEDVKEETVGGGVTPFRDQLDSLGVTDQHLLNEVKSRSSSLRTPQERVDNTKHFILARKCKHIIIIQSLSFLMITIILYYVEEC